MVYKKIYLDTNIYLDYLLARKNKSGKDLATPAFLIMNRALSCEFFIIVSTWTLQELYKHVDYEKTKMLFTLLKRKSIYVQFSDEDINDAKRKSSHFQDPLHGILAVKAGADIVITRDLSGFDCVSDLIQIKLPENI